MKKLFFVIVCLLMCVNVSAVNNTFSIEYPDEEVTVSFTSNLEYEEMKIIADRIVYGDSSVEPYSILCIFGHNTEIHYVSAMKHKVLTNAPRCVEQYFEVEICKNCDYADMTLISQVWMSCCPED